VENQNQKTTGIAKLPTPTIYCTELFGQITLFCVFSRTLLAIHKATESRASCLAVAVIDFED